MTQESPERTPEHRLREAAKQLRLYAEETDDEQAQDLARMVELKELPEYEGEPQFEELIAQVRDWRTENVGETGMLRAAAKMSTEAAEVLDPYIKAEDWPAHEVDEEELEREVGDVFVTLVGVCQESGLALDDCIEAAMQKNASETWKEDRGL